MTKEEGIEECIKLDIRAIFSEYVDSSDTKLLHHLLYNGFIGYKNLSSKVIKERCKEDHHDRRRD